MPARSTRSRASRNGCPDRDQVEIITRQPTVRLKRLENRTSLLWHPLPALVACRDVWHGGHNRGDYEEFGSAMAVLRGGAGCGRGYAARPGRVGKRGAGHSGCAMHERRRLRPCRRRRRAVRAADARSLPRQPRAGGQERAAAPGSVGYYPGPADGQYGADLQEAVWAFQGGPGPADEQRDSNSVITYAFRRALVHPRQPYAAVSRMAAPDRIEINQSIQVLVLYRNNKPYLILHVSSGGRYHYCGKRQLRARDNARRQVHGLVVPARRHQGPARLHGEPGLLHRPRLCHSRWRPGAVVPGLARLRPHL